MSNLEFAWGFSALLLLCVVPMWLHDRKHARDQGSLWSPQAGLIKELLGKAGSLALQKKPSWLMVLAWSLLVVALMRPQHVGQPIEITRDGRNIMLVLDISESMEARDMKISGESVSRLDSAKVVLSDFIDKRHGDRLGLVVFGSESFLHAPLSFDHPTIKQFLTEAEIGFAGPKTAIGDAIGLSVKKLIEQTEGQKTVVLLTDGQNNAGSLEPSQAAQIAKQQGIKIYIVGLGSSRMMVHGFFGPTPVNPSASLDEAESELKEIAATTGGNYFRARDFDGLSTIYEEIDKLEPVRADSLVLIPRKELFYWPLAGFIGLWAMRAWWMLARSKATLVQRRKVSL
ncbi:MAG TPA: VWA domain-containing protein [Myxococcota bacterium]|nr:VWA domain-containing protein [Myxococcota bacterium]